MSLASAQMAEARRRANSTEAYYNLKLGPSRWRFIAGLGLEYNSNVRYREGAESDFILRPGVEAQMRWPVTERNSLHLDLGLGYSVYLQEEDLSRFYISPGSAIAFDIYAGDFLINLHNRFSIQQDAYRDPTVAGGDFAQLENAAGISGLWDLNELKFRAGYDYLTFTRIAGEAARPDGEQNIFYSKAGAELMPGSLLGLELGTALVNYQSGSEPVSDGWQWNAGAFLETPITEYIGVSGSVGYTDFEPFGSETGMAASFSGLYVQASTEHRLNQYVTYVLSGGRRVSFAFHAGTVDLLYLRWSANWRFLHKTGLSTSFELSQGEQLYQGGENFQQLGGSLSLSRKLTEKLAATFSLSSYSRDSDALERDYSVYTIGTNLRYAF